MQITALDAWLRGKQLTMAFPRRNSFKFKEGHSIINLPITIFNKSEVDQAEDAEITIYVNTLPSESLKKIHWSNFHFSRCGGAALGIVWI